MTRIQDGPLTEDELEILRVLCIGLNMAGESITMVDGSVYSVEFSLVKIKETYYFHPRFKEVSEEENHEYRGCAISDM